MSVGAGVDLLARADLGPQYVFTNSVLAPWDPDGITRFWREDATRAVTEGLVSRYMRLHDARHWYATQLVAAGTDLNTVADQLGHSSPAFTLAVYGHSDATRATCRSRRRRGRPVGLTAR